MPVTPVLSKDQATLIDLQPTFDGLTITVSASSFTYRGIEYTLDDDYEYPVDVSLDGRDVQVCLAVNTATQMATLLVADTAADDLPVAPVAPPGFKRVLQVVGASVPQGASSITDGDVYVFTVEEDAL